MSEFKLNLSGFSKDKLVELKTNTEEVKNSKTSEANSLEISDVDIENIFANSEEISTDNMMLFLSGKNNIDEIPEGNIAEYNLYANLMANGDDSITKEEALSFAKLDGNTTKLSKTDFQEIINDIEDYDNLLSEINNSIEENILTNNKMNVINSGAEYDTATGTYKVKVESYTNSKVDDGQGGKRFCNGSLWGITENVYGSNVDKTKLYKFIQEMNPQIKDINILYDGDTINLPILKYDDNGNITGYEKNDLAVTPDIKPENNEDNSYEIKDEDNSKIENEETNGINNEDSSEVNNEDTSEIEDKDTSEIIEEETSNIDNNTSDESEFYGPPVPSDYVEPTKDEKNNNGVLMGGNISGDKFQGNFWGTMEMFFESNFASFDKKFDANGELDKAAYQGNTGDCVFISGCYALASNEKGYNLIKDSITINKNEAGEIESYTVEFKGINEKYTVTQEELKKATKPKLSRLLGNFAKYAGGDEDMTLLELAYKKCANSTKSDKVSFADCEKELDGLDYDNFYKAFTGQSFEHLDPKEFITNLENGSLSSNTVGQIGFSEKIKVKDINGKKVKLVGEHAYTINEVTKDTVTLLNPWNTGEEIVLSRQTFESLNPDNCNVIYVDLDKTDKEE